MSQRGDITSVKRILTVGPGEMAPPQRHPDPGAAFPPRPARRTDQAVFGIKAGDVAVTSPGNRPSEVRYQLENGDWSDWRAAGRPFPASVRIIGVEWRLKA